MIMGGGRVKVLLVPVCFELLLGGPYGCVSRTRQTEFGVCFLNRENKR